MYYFFRLYIFSISRFKWNKIQINIKLKTMYSLSYLESKVVRIHKTLIKLSLRLSLVRVVIFYIMSFFQYFKNAYNKTKM